MSFAMPALKLASEATEAQSDSTGVTPYVKAVRDCILAGGCSSSRAAVVGACLAARDGISAVPASWIARIEATSPGLVQAALRVALAVAK